MSLHSKKLGKKESKEIQSNELFKPKRKLAGSATLVRDIENSSKEISAAIHDSLSRSEKDL